MTQATKQHLDFLNALADFKNAAARVSELWYDADTTGTDFNKDYPFTEDFETVVRNIVQWHQTQYNAAKGDEPLLMLQPETASEFINSILAEEKKDFPKNIEVTIERSNNPHGEYEMSVVANDELLASYWYDTREEAQQDADKLEDFCNVTFI